MPKEPQPKRVVTHLDEGAFDWLGRKATSLGLTMAAYIRMVLLGEKARDDA